MRSRRLGPGVAALAGMLLCAAHARAMLNPFSLEAVFRRDWAQHALGFLFFRNQGWAFPLGRLDDLLSPLGTSVGYMDSIPLMAFAFRPISALLPADFQYLGLWLVLCGGALALVSAWYLTAFTDHWEQQALGGMLTVASPTLLQRFNHPALCMHALVVAALVLNLHPNLGRRRLGWMFVLLLVSAAVHPYLALMVLAIALGVPLQLRRELGPLSSSAALAAAVGVTALMLWMLGYLGAGMQDAIGMFGVYSSNLNTLWNSLGHSRLFGALPSMRGQHEGYGYLGAGVFLLALSALGTLLVPSTRARVLALPWRLFGWPLCVSLACAFFALASPIFWGAREVLRIDAYEHVRSLVDTLRSSGRFIWPVVYSIVLAALATVVAAWSPRRALLSGLLGACVLLQLVDVAHQDNVVKRGTHRKGQLSAAAWSLADGAYEHLVLYPAEIKDNCEGPAGYRATPITELAYLAYRHRWTFNSGYAARVRSGTGAYCEGLKRDVSAGKLDSTALYVSLASAAAAPLRSAGAICGQVDHVAACVAPSDSRFARFLAAPAR